MSQYFLLLIILATIVATRGADNYDWKDSNMAFFGSEADKQIKKEAAKHETAWNNAGSDVGIQIWRIVKFKIEVVPKENYGKFYSGDSYIILNTYRVSSENKLKYDLHFWIGNYSTQDEYGTAAYKTVELDSYLDGRPIQHREVQGHESALFQSYFTGGMTYLRGGADNGFRRIDEDNDVANARLFQIKRVAARNITVTKVNCNRSSITSDDVFILDLGSKIYQINGINCSPDEKYTAAIEVQNIRNERNGRADTKISTSSDHTLMKELNKYCKLAY